MPVKASRIPFLRADKIMEQEAWPPVYFRVFRFQIQNLNRLARDGLLSAFLTRGLGLAGLGDSAGSRI